MRKIKYSLCLLLPLVLGCDYRYDGVSYDELGSGFFIVHDRGRPFIGKEVSPNSHSYQPVIFPYIKNYAMNKDFILISRLVTEYDYRDRDADSVWLVQNSNDSLQYWIIEKQKSNVTGPLNEKEFQKARIELTIPEDLRLKIE